MSPEESKRKLELLVARVVAAVAKHASDRQTLRPLSECNTDRSGRQVS